MQRSAVLHVQHLILVSAVFLISCDCGEDETSPPAPSGVDVEDLSGLVVDGDHRLLSERLTAALGIENPPATRRAAARVVSRLGTPDSEQVLVQTLRDPDPGVRGEASFGLGLLGTPSAGEALIRSLAAESHPAVRSLMTADLGRCGGASGLPALTRALSSLSSDERAAGCRAIAGYLQRDVPVPGDVIDAASNLLVAESSDVDADPMDRERVREDCAFALSRLSASTRSERFRANLIVAASDASADVRRFSIRTLGKLHEPPLETIVDATEDSDWVVAVTAFQSLKRLVPPRAPTVPLGLPEAYARAARARLDAVEEDALFGPPLHVLVEALSVPASLGNESSVSGVLSEALDRFSSPANRDAGLLHCVAAMSLDEAQGSTDRTASCGGEQVLPWERQVRTLEVIGRLTEPDDEDMAQLERLGRSEDGRVRGAAVSASKAMPHPVAAGIVLRALRSQDPGLIAIAAEALGPSLPTWVVDDAEPPTFASVRLAGEPAPPPPTSDSPFPSARQVHRALLEAGEYLLEEPDAEALQSWMGALLATENEGFRAQLTTLSGSSNQAIREKAQEVILGLGWPAAEVPLALVDNPIEAEQLSSLPTAAVLETSRGEIHLRLFATDAPTTVARFVGLAQEGYYDGLSFHRVVPGFVVQGGDPRGDGYGGPGWAQRCEPSRTSYSRGTVGMALAGRDTGGSQFFITHSSQPHLSGRYTPFAQVSDGMDHVDQIQVGDTIHQIRFGD